MALNQWYNGMVSYLWSDSNNEEYAETDENSNMSDLARLKRLSSLMRDSNYKEQTRNQICNFYSQLIKEYPQTKSTFQYPKCLYEPQIYTQKICFQVLLNINVAEVKGVLELFILFPEQLDKQMPFFYIKNPNYSMSKPNKKFVKFGVQNEEGKYYKAVMGGVQVLLPQISNERWQWTSNNYYKETNILNMVRWIHKQLVLEQFPFIKRKKEKQDSIYEQAKQLRIYLKGKFKIQNNIQQSPLLENIQDLHSLQSVINLQIDKVYLEIGELKKIQQDSQKWNIKQFLPVPQDKRSEILLQAVSSLDALRDTVYLLELKLHNSEIEFSQFQKYTQNLFKKEFEMRHKINYWELPEIL